MKPGQSRAPQSVKNQGGQFFPSKCSPIKDYQYASENPTPMRRQSKEFGFQMPKTNMISINNGVHNQVYYIQPIPSKQGQQQLNLSSGGESLDQFWKRQSYNTSHQNSNQLLDQQPKKSKAQTQLFSMLMNDALNRTTLPERKSSKTNTNTTTPHNINNSYNMRRDQHRNNNSLQRRLEETYNLQPLPSHLQFQSKSTKSKHSNNYSSSQHQQQPQPTSWYLPQPRYNPPQQPAKQQQHNSKQLMNQSLGEVSFENNILQRGFQGDYSGFLQIQSDTSKNDIKSDDYEMSLYNQKAIDLLQQAKQMLKNKTIAEAIDLLKQSIDVDPSVLESHYFLGISYLGIFQYTKAIQEFQQVVNGDPKHRRNVYLLLAISYKKINEIEQAINTVKHYLERY